MLAEARTAAETIELVSSHAPDVAVIDAGGAALEGVHATRAIHARQPSQLIVVLAREEDEQTALLALGRAPRASSPRRSTSRRSRARWPA